MPLACSKAPATVGSPCPGAQLPIYTPVKDINERYGVPQRGPPSPYCSSRYLPNAQPAAFKIINLRDSIPLRIQLCPVRATGLREQDMLVTGEHFLASAQVIPSKLH